MLDKKNRLALKSTYQAYRCMLCYDKLNMFSDIVAGDPYGFQHADQKLGYSILIARTEKGRQLLTRAVEQGVLVLSEASYDTVVAGQKMRAYREDFDASAAVSAENNWAYPYTTEQTRPISRLKMIAKQKTLVSARRFYTATSEREIAAHIAQCEKRRAWEKKTALPRRVIRKLKRALHIG